MDRLRISLPEQTADLGLLSGAFHLAAEAPVDVIADGAVTIEASGAIPGSSKLLETSSRYICLGKGQPMVQGHFVYQQRSLWMW